MKAVEIGNEEIIKMLLDKGAKPDATVNNRTPLSVAKEVGNQYPDSCPSLDIAVSIPTIYI